MSGALAHPHPLARLAPAGGVALVLATLAALCARDALARRAAWVRDEGARRAAAALVGGPELATHAASRWLRHPARSEPWSPFLDGPALLDTDPAGALLAPPRALYASDHASTTLRVRRP